MAKLTEQKKEKFLRLLKETGNVSKSAQAIGIKRQTLYQLRDKDPKFKEEWQEAFESFLDSCEQEVVRRGVKGYEKPVFYGGKQIGTVREYSDNLLMFYLKRYRPEFRDRLKVEGNIPVFKTPSEEVQAELKELAKRLARRELEKIRKKADSDPDFISDSIH